jgi:flagellar basal body-associated protein FliL
MNRTKLPILLSTLALLLIATMMLQPTMFAQQDTPSQQPKAQQDTGAPQAMNQSTDSRTFTGKITKASGKYVLRDEATKATYSLDDQDSAKKFEGKSVKVTGKLDAQTNTIQVSAIEPAS